jgi:AraC-like DNA-binding protein
VRGLCDVDLHESRPSIILDAVNYSEHQPHPLLEEAVKCFWTHEGTYAPDKIQPITPDGCIELIFNFGSPYQLLSRTPPQQLPPAIIVGFQKETLPISVDGTVRVVAARMFPWGALALLQEEVRALTGQIKDLDPSWNALARELQDHVTQGRYESAWHGLQDYLLQKALAQTYEAKLVESAAKLLFHTKGQCRVEELADYCHTSVRQLQRHFDQTIGVSPKFYARTIRFARAQQRLMLQADSDLTELAYDCGYFDQAHFIKDFRAFTGRTPSQYAKEMQDLQTELKTKDVVFLQSD